MAYVIYRILNTANGLSYIGQTNNFPRRKKEHLSELKSNRHSNSYLQRAYNKYGRKNFVFEILKTDIPSSEISEVEIAYIDFYDTYINGYNGTSGGEIGVANSIECEWNGKKYESIKNAADANNIPPRTMAGYIAQGITQDSEIPRGGNYYNIPFEWNGIQYESYNQAAIALGVSPQSIRFWHNRGWKSDKDRQEKSQKSGWQNAKKVEWNGFIYPSLKVAAIMNSIGIDKMRYWLDKGCTCDDDIDYEVQPNVPCEWNGISYNSYKEAADANGIHPATMRNRILSGYTCDDDVLRRWPKSEK